MSEKVKAQHLERGAYVYVRQSTPYQVRNNLESKERQYALEGRAQQLGFSKVVVIDEDLGRSGSGIQERPGFGRLLASVCQGLAGAVFALEASRLARNNRDWHHLVDLCALTETLLIDCDGIYDPRQLNDRLVLGLKGTMSEFELGLLRQRAREAFEQKVRRGFALWEVPVGFIRTEEGQIEKTPDRQVQQAVVSVFRKFQQLGSARQATIWFREEQILVPKTKPGTAGQEVTWGVPSSGRIRQMLKNPCYAGTFAYGKTAARTRIEEGRARQSSRYRKPQKSGRCCFWAIIRGTSVGRSIWKTNNGWRPMWQCTRVKAAVRRSWVPLCCPACCAAGSAAGNCKLSTAVPAAACRGTSVAVIEEIGSPAGA
jgi:DNA invertase Pin-like site-specific DNA recombinase